MATAIFYASSTGNTADAAKQIVENLGGDIACIDIADNGVTLINEYDKVILGISTWGDGELQDDWEDVWDEFCDISFCGKKVALFGLGDQDGYSEYYLDAMGIVCEQVQNAGAKLIGSCEVTDEYDFEESKAVIDDRFVGLALDADNQDELTSVRIARWCQDIKKQIL